MSEHYDDAMYRELHGGKSRDDAKVLPKSETPEHQHEHVYRCQDCDDIGMEFKPPVDLFEKHDCSCGRPWTWHLRRMEKYLALHPLLTNQSEGKKPMKWDVRQWRDVDGTPYHQVTVNCECGNGGFKRFPVDTTQSTEEEHD